MCIERKALSGEGAAHVHRIIKVLRDEVRYAGKLTEDQIRRQMQIIFDMVPKNSILVALAADENYKNGYTLIKRGRATSYNRCLKEVSEEFDNVYVASIRNCVEAAHELQSTDHFDRIVYYRLTQGIVQAYCDGWRRNREAP